LKHYPKLLVCPSSFLGYRPGGTDVGYAFCAFSDAFGFDRYPKTSIDADASTSCLAGQHRVACILTFGGQMHSCCPRASPPLYQITFVGSFLNLIILVMLIF
jgi:hypothetical protein